MMRKAVALLLGIASGAWALEVQPVIDAELMMGQYWYNGADSSVGGIASLSASPYLKFNDRWSLVPLYQGRYQGTQQVTDFTGGGTLFNDSQSHDISLKGIRSFDHGLKLKVIGAYGVELLRETEDEGWTDGLYDNRRLSGGLEGEWSWAENEFLRLGYDYYQLNFPNYESLESQAGPELGRELAQPDVLDNKNHRLALSVQKLAPGKGVISARLSQTFRSFSEQHLVDASGSLVSDTRHDSLPSLAVDGTWPVWTGEAQRLITTFGYGWTHLMSDQNSYDAGRTTFLPNYYSNVQQAITNRWTMLFGAENPWSLQFAASLGRQVYSDRPEQNSVGTYGTDTTRVDYATLGLGFDYPIAKGFKLTGRMDLGWSDSNNTYTQVYQYHYNTASYLMGFRYAY